MKIFNLLAITQVYAQDAEESCGVGEVDVEGLCVEASYAAQFANLLQEADQEEEQASNSSINMRRFPLPGSSEDASNNLRTKKRTQQSHF